MRYKIVIIILFFITTACVDTHKELFVSKVNIENLREMLTRQKCHNKAIFIFDPACPTCIYYLTNEFPLIHNKFLDSLDYVFISTDTIPFEKYKKFFYSIGITRGHLLSLHKNKQDYLQANEKIISKVIQCVFSNTEEIHVQGFPISAIANKDNKLKLEYYCIEDSSIIIRPKPWHEFYVSSLNEIDFDTIEDLVDENEFQ